MNFDLNLSVDRYFHWGSEAGEAGGVGIAAKNGHDGSTQVSLAVSLCIRVGLRRNFPDSDRYGGVSIRDV